MTEEEEFEMDMEQRKDTMMKIICLALEAYELENDKPFDVDPAIFNELLARYQEEEKYTPNVAISFVPGKRLVISSVMVTEEEARGVNDENA